MDAWQKFAVIIAFLTFIRLIIRDILEYIQLRKMRIEEAQKEETQKEEAPNLPKD